MRRRKESGWVGEQLLTLHETGDGGKNFFERSAPDLTLAKHDADAWLVERVRITDKHLEPRDLTRRDEPLDSLADEIEVRHGVGEPTGLAECSGGDGDVASFHGVFFLFGCVCFVGSESSLDESDWSAPDEKPDAPCV